MQSQGSAPRHGLVVARGYGIKIRTSRGHLVVDDGIGDERQTRRFHRATSKLRRLVVIGQTGYVSLEATRWLYDARAAYVQLDVSGRLIAMSAARGADLPALRRIQALAADSDLGLELARDLLGQKINGQYALLAELPAGENAAPSLERALIAIRDASTLEALLGAESFAAEAYWQAWSPLRIRFGARDTTRVPEHWLTFNQRASLLSSGNRNATNPASAILNLLYRLIEIEITLALHAVGVDPGIGVWHRDRPDRNSLTLDCLEALRPLADAYLLALLTQRKLAAGDFVETRQGGCRLHPQLAASLVQTLPAWRRHAAPLAEDLAHAFARACTSKIPLSTPLTRRNQREALDARLPNRRRSNAIGGGVPVLPRSCPDCGHAIRDRRRHYCDDCRAERIARRGDRARQNAQTVLAQLRAEQRDPAHGGRAGQIRGAKNSAHQLAVRAWPGELRDPAEFCRTILPGLRRVPIPDLMAATGLSQHYCSLIRLGKKVPHVRHWDALSIVGADNP